MAGQARVEGLTLHDRKQDCGCGCGGSLCETASHDCGCGCGGIACGAETQEIVFVGAVADRAQGASAAKQCDCGCDCCG